MRIRWLGWALLGLIGCDEKTSTSPAEPMEQPAEPMQPMEPPAEPMQPMEPPAESPNPPEPHCGSLLARPGIRTVANYNDAYLTQANADVALLETTDGDVRWLRLDTLEMGEFTISNAFQNASITLLDAAHVMMSGYDHSWDFLTEVRRLSDDTITERVAGSSAIRGQWTYLREPSQMLNLLDGVSQPFDCQDCYLKTIDAYDRAWLTDRVENEPVSVDLSTGEVRRYSDYPDSDILRVGPGIVIGDYRRNKNDYVGADGEPVSCSGRILAAAPTGEFICARRDGVAVFNAAGGQTRFIDDTRVRGAQVMGESFVYSGWSLARNNRAEAVARVPFDAQQPTERIEGILLETYPTVAVVLTADTIPPTLRFVDDSGLRDFELHALPVDVSMDGTRGVVQLEDTRQLVDLTTGAVLADVPLEGWVRFVGNTLLHDGVPLGGERTRVLSHLLVPDEDCPAALLELCDGQDCALSIFNAQ